MSISVTTVDHLCSIMVGRPGPDPIILLGAGASVSSGIPLSSSIVELAARQAYCFRNGREPEDQTVTRDEYINWLMNQEWFQPSIGLAENYPAVVDYLLQPRDARRLFFKQILEPRQSPGKGYELLSELLARNVLQTVLTTNFDEVLPKLYADSHYAASMELIQTRAEYDLISYAPGRPQIIYLHGSVKHYTDKNIREEIRRLDDDLVRELLPLMRDRPLVVIGYRGAEASVMQHLLRDNLTELKHFRFGVYWCVRDEDPDKLHPFVRALATKLKGNFQLVPFKGFDELLEQVWRRYLYTTDIKEMQRLVSRLLERGPKVLMIAQELLDDASVSPRKYITTKITWEVGLSTAELLRDFGMLEHPAGDAGWVHHRHKVFVITEKGNEFLHYLKHQRSQS